MGIVISGYTVVAQTATSYIIDARGNKIVGQSLSADQSGNLSIQLEANGPVQVFKRGTYRTAFVPKTKEIQALEQAATQKNSDGVAKAAPALFAKYQFLGWGGHISYLEGMVQVDKGNFAAALTVFDRGLALGDAFQEELLKGKVHALLGLKKNAEAQAALGKLILAADEKTAAFACNARGKLLAADGKKKDAVLEYMKTLLLFKPGQMTAERDEARKALVALLKEMGDSRAAEFEKLP
jgi:tetratricopeptide (TPR) repeat protein